MNGTMRGNGGLKILRLVAERDDGYEFGQLVWPRHLAYLVTT